MVKRQTEKAGLEVAMRMYNGRLVYRYTIHNPFYFYTIESKIEPNQFSDIINTHFSGKKEIKEVTLKRLLKKLEKEKL